MNSLRFSFLTVSLSLLASTIGCGGSGTSTNTPTAIPTSPPTTTPTKSPSPTPTVVPTSSPSAGPSSRPSPTPNPTSTPSATPHPSPTPNPTKSPSPVPTAATIYLPPTGTIYVGARTNPQGLCAENDSACLITQTAALETSLQRKLALNDSYHGWAVAFPGPQEQDDIANERIPVIAWNCGHPDAAVAAGQYDTDITAAATSIKAFGKPVFLRFFWEFNISDSSNGGRQKCYDPATDGTGDPSHTVPATFFSPTQYVAAWRHIHDKFAALGVTNVVWVWCPSSGSGGPPATSYYPGDAYVDWLAYDTYDRVSGQSFSATISSLYNQLTSIPSATPKPILMAENGALPSDQVAYLTSAQTMLPSSFPRIKGFMYFDASGAAGSWALTTTTPPNGLSTFTTLANSAYFTATPRL